MSVKVAVRLAPSGQVIGLELEVALQTATARGYDIAVLSELLPAAEAGMVEALTSDTNGEGHNPSDSRHATDMA